MNDSPKRTSHHFEVPIENYLKAIWNLSQKKSSENLGVRNSELAEYLEIKRPSVSSMIKKLLSRGLIQQNGRRGISLSPKGMKRVIDLLRRHRLIEVFLKEKLNMDPLSAHREAELLEHAVSPQLIAAIDRELGSPTHDSLGLAIPRLGQSRFDDQFQEKICYQDLNEGDRVSVSALADYSPVEMKKLIELGFKQGSEFTVTQKADSEIVVKLKKQSRILKLDSTLLKNLQLQILNRVF